jgi:hypothetical protein
MLTKLSCAAVAAALLAMPAFGQITTLPGSTQATRSHPVQRVEPTPAQQPLSALSTEIPDTVHEGGHKYLGRDPDPEVRYQIMKDESMHKGNSY